MELIEEDWNSNEAKDFSIVLAFIIALTAIVGIALTIVIITMLPDTPITLGFTITVTALFILAFTAFAPAVRNSKVFRVPGAYLHCWKRVKAGIPF
jgi:hypothetical protein